MNPTGIWLAAAALAAAGCSTAEFQADEAPSGPLGTYGSLQVRPPEAEPSVLAALDPEQRTRLDRFLRGLPERLAAAWKARGGPDVGAERVLGVELRVVKVDPGDRTLRWAVGFGAGKGTLEARVIFREPEGPVLASGLARGTISGGVFGGTFETAEDGLIRAIVDYLGRESDGR